MAACGSGTLGRGHLGHSVEAAIAKTSNKGESQEKESRENGLFPVRCRPDEQSTGRLSPAPRPLHVVPPPPLGFKFKTPVLSLTLHSSSPTWRGDCGEQGSVNRKKSGERPRGAGGAALNASGGGCSTAARSGCGG